MITLGNDIKPFSRIMDRAYLRDKSSGIEYTGEALMIALLLRCKKRRGKDQEQELKQVLGVKD